MRGVILAGGIGSRLGKITGVINKHLLPIGDSPMIEHPLYALRKSGIEDITIVSSAEGIGQLAKYLGSGYTYRVQDTPAGTVNALACAMTTSQESVAVILGDNIFSPPPILRADADASVYLAEVEDASAFGVAKFENNALIGFVEKPKDPPSHWAVTGLYVFTANALFDVQAYTGEYAMTDYLNAKAGTDALHVNYHQGFWGDAGTFEGLNRCRRGVCAF